MGEHCCKNNHEQKPEGQCCAKGDKSNCFCTKIKGFFKKLFGCKQGESCCKSEGKNEGCCQNHSSEKEANGQCCKNHKHD